ncbi:MAG: hypothetical protein CMI12_00860 [Oceanospirillum sp.]|nr:hypothetical protein [Oceanospirillum sp.]
MVNEFAVYSEYSNQKASLQQGANIRKFTHVDSEQGDSITLMPETGVIRLKQGLYHITASAATGVDGAEANTHEAYCQLSYACQTKAQQGPISIGSQAVPDMIPSLVDTFLRVDDDTGIVLEYQVDHSGEKASTLAENDTNLQVFSRISILKMEDASTLTN